MEKDKFKELHHPQNSLLNSLKLSNAFNNSSGSSSRDEQRGIVSSEDERDQKMRRTLEDYQYNSKLQNQQAQIFHLQTIAQSPLQSIFHPNTIQPVSSNNSQTLGQSINSTVHQYTHKRTTPPLFPMTSLSQENTNNNAKQHIMQQQQLKQQQQANTRTKNSISVAIVTAVGSNSQTNQPPSGTQIKTNPFDLERIQISEDSYLRQHSQQQQQQLYSTSSSQYSSSSASFRKGLRGSSSEEAKHRPIQQYQQLPKEQQQEKQPDLQPTQPSNESQQPRFRISRSDAKEQHKSTDQQQILAPSSMQVVSSFARRRSSSGIQINPPLLKITSREDKNIPPERLSPLLPYNSHTNNHQIRTKSSPFLAGTSQVNSHQTTPSPVRKGYSPLRASPIIPAIRRSASPNQSSETPLSNSRTSTPAKKPNGLLISNKESTTVATTATTVVNSQYHKSFQHSPDQQQQQSAYEKLQTSYNLLETHYKDVLEELSRVRAEQQITIEEKNKQLGRALQELEKLLLDNTTISERCYTAQESLKFKLSEISQMKQQHFDDIQNLRKAAKQEVTRLVDEEVKRMVGPLIKENTRLEIELSRVQEQFTLSQRRDIQFQDEKQQQQQQQSIFSEDDSSQIYAINNTRAYKINEELTRANELLMREKEELKNESDKWREKYAAICDEMSGIRDQFLQYMKVIEEIKKYKQIEENANMKNNQENDQQQQQQWYQLVQNQQIGYQKQPSQMVQQQQQQQQQQLYHYDPQTTLTTDTFDGDEQFEQEIRREILTGLKSTNPGSYIVVDQRNNEISHGGKNDSAVSSGLHGKIHENNLINISNYSQNTNGSNPIHNSGKKLHKRLKSAETNELKLIGWDKMSEEQETDTYKQQIITNQGEISMIKSAQQQQQCKTLGDEFSFTAQDDQVAEDALSLRKYEEELISQHLQQQQEQQQQLQKQQEYPSDTVFDVFERQQQEKAIIDHTTFKEQFAPRILNNVACIESLQIGQDQQTQGTKDNFINETTPNPASFNNSSGYQSTEKSAGNLSSNKEQQQREGSNSKANATNYNSLSKNSNNMNNYSSNSKNSNNNNNLNGTISTLLNSVQSLRKLTNQGMVPTDQPITQNIEDKNKYSDGNINTNNRNSNEVIANIKETSQTQDFEELRKRYQQTVQALLGLKAGRISNSTILNVPQNQQLNQGTAANVSQEIL